MNPQRMFTAPFSFEGRIRRTEYGLSYIIFIVFSSIIEEVLESFILDEATARLCLYVLYIPAYWFVIAQGAKRCHDRGNSAWYQLIPFYIFWMIFANGEIGVNQYGLNPKGIGNIDEIDLIGSDMS